MGVGVLGGLIYAVGGYDGNSRQCLASVEVYNPDQGENTTSLFLNINPIFTRGLLCHLILTSLSDIWCPVSDMSARRSGAGVGVLHGLLYSVGGHDGPLVRKSVECYNSDNNRWTPVADMNYCRRSHMTHSEIIFSLNDKIFSGMPE